MPPLAGAVSSALTSQPQLRRDDPIQPGNVAPPTIGEGNTDTSIARVIYTTVSLVCMLLLATMLGFRIRNLRDRQKLLSMSFIRVLVYIMYFLAIAFVLSAAILESGLDLSTLGSCRAAIYVCLIFYVSSKVCVQTFLVERAHAIRFHIRKRCDDVLWLVSMLIVGFGFGTIAILAFLWPIADIAPTDRKCRIGLPFKVTIPLLTYDILINVALTGVFVALLRPLLRFRTSVAGVSHGMSTFQAKRPRQSIRGIPTTQVSACHVHHPAQHSTQNSATSLTTVEMDELPVRRDVTINPQLRVLRLLVWKSLIGGVVVLIPTIVNLALLYRWQGEEQGWLCFTVCTFDVTWSVCVVHLLTVDPSEEARAQPVLMMAAGAG